MKKLLLGYYSIIGYLYKFLVDIGLVSIPSLSANCENNVIVSITSYGRRVSTSVVYYTLVSILRQSQKPKRIILWLDKLKWSESTLPSRLLSLKKNGVEFILCNDVKSYTKLVPCVKKYPKDIIVTLDDDIIYSSHTIEQLLKAHSLYPNDICCFQALKIQCVNDIPTNYHRWVNYMQSYRGKGLIFPLGVGGVLYPPNCLHQDVLREDLFLRLCPHADDIWFWLCGLRAGTNVYVIEKKGRDYSFDSLYQYLHKGSALTHTNRSEHQNDNQFLSVMNHYNMRIRNGILVPA